MVLVVVVMAQEGSVRAWPPLVSVVHGILAEELGHLGETPRGPRGDKGGHEIADGLGSFGRCRPTLVGQRARAQSLVPSSSTLTSRSLPNPMVAVPE